MCPPQGKMIMQDKLEKERNDAKNNVEEYVYDMRDKLHGLLEKFVSESVSILPLYNLTRIENKWCGVIQVNSFQMQDRDTFSLRLEDTENWLYEDGEDQQKQVYIDKLAELKVTLSVNSCLWF